MAGNQNSGRLSKDTLTRQMEQTLSEAGVYAVKELRDFLRGDNGHRAPKVSPTRIRAIELAIAHAIGLPRQRLNVNLSGELLTWVDLARLAEHHREALPQSTSEDTANELPPAAISEEGR